MLLKLLIPVALVIGFQNVDFQNKTIQDTMNDLKKSISTDLDNGNFNKTSSTVSKLFENTLKQTSLNEIITNKIYKFVEVQKYKSI